MGCASCRNNAARPQAPAPLFQIRQGYRARWSELTVSVESDSGDWTLCVQNAGRTQTLYTAHRSAARAAMVAAVEFAIFLVLGPQNRLNPDRLATELTWQSY